MYPHQESRARSAFSWHFERNRVCHSSQYAAVEVHDPAGISVYARQRGTQQEEISVWPVPPATERPALPALNVAEVRAHLLPLDLTLEGAVSTTAAAKPTSRRLPLRSRRSTGRR